MQKFRDAVLATTDRPAGALRPVSGATVTVLNLDGTTPTLYSDNGVTPLASNVVTTDSSGEYSFYAANGRYRLTIASSTVGTESVSDITLFDSADAGAVDATKVSYTPPGVAPVATTVATKLQEGVSAKDQGVLFNGTTETTALQKLFTAAANREGRINAGTVKTAGVTLGAASKIRGEGKALTTLRRTANANLISSTTADDTEIADLSVNMDKTTLGYDGHGVVNTQSRSTVRNVNVSDFGSTSGGGGTGIINFGTAGRQRHRVIDCDVVGNTATMTAVGGISYGWIYENCDCSFARGIYAATCRNYAHELKDSATYNVLSDLIAEGSGTAVGYGQQLASGAQCNVAHGIVSKNCDVGFTGDYMNYNVTSALVHDNRAAPAVSGTSHLIRLESNASQNAIFGALGVGSFVDTVRLYASSNYAQVVSHDTTTTLVSFQSGAAKNAVEVAHPGARTSIFATSVISDASGNSNRGSNANVVWCHATGERAGSLSGKFRDRFGASGASFNSGHYWIKEDTTNAVQAYATSGTAGDSAGIAYSMPGASTQGTFLYTKTASDAGDYWSLRVGNTATVRFFNSTIRPETDNAISLGTASVGYTNVFSRQLTLTPPASATPASNGNLVFELTSNTELKIKVKGSDGTVRSVSLTLA
jgi:hypothetical protein